MVVPFRDNITRRMIPVISHIIDKLILLMKHGKDILESKAMPTQGGLWTSLQFECALEKFFWGKLNSVGMNWATYNLLKEHSVNLGPGHNVPTRSNTDHLGFLCLCNFEESLGRTSELPPFRIWTSFQIQVTI